MKTEHNNGYAAFTQDPLNPEASIAAQKAAEEQQKQQSASAVSPGDAGSSDLGSNAIDLGAAFIPTQHDETVTEILTDNPVTAFLEGTGEVLGSVVEGIGGAIGAVVDGIGDIFG
jgi:hypothetical protein